MANTFVVSRSHLIYGVCLPVAVVLGYLLAEPLDSGTLSVVVLVLSILSIPLMMRWHHALLIFSVNSVICPFFLPGQPAFWMIMAVVSLFFSIINRSVGQELRFFEFRSVSLSLLFLSGVVLITAWLNGGVGVAALGSSTIGGKKYLSTLLAVALYFALATPRINRKLAWCVVGYFFLSTMTALVGYIAAFVGPSLYFLVELFPIQTAIEQTSEGNSLAGQSVDRYGDLSIVAIGIFCFLMARYGARGVLDLKKIWRLLLLLLAFVLNLYAGFRSNVILFTMTFAVMFYMEGLFRTRHFPILILTGALAGAILISNIRSMPLPAQRALSFLPIVEVDPLAKLSAEGSTTWRLEIWTRALQEVPKYWLKGKGYSMDAVELSMVQAVNGNAQMSQEGALLAGDYHSGPLSLIIPFGIFGVAGFVWFLAASLQILRNNYRFGDPALQQFNAFLFAYFIVKIIFFFFVFGSFQSDLCLFAALVGLSVSLNGRVCHHSQEQLQEPGLEELMSADAS